MAERSEILITCDELAAAMDSAASGGRPVRVLDVRWRLDQPDGRADHRAGHIPGAVYVDLDRQLAKKGDPREGRHPLPPIERFEKDARSWGIDDGDLVVVYDDLGNMSSARAWWLLRHAGVADARMLDGALEAWRASGHALESGDVHVTEGTVRLAFGHLPVVTMQEAAAFATTGVLLDARAPERYRGETEPIDPRAGHIPGARSTPTIENLDDSGRFLDERELRARFAAVGVGDGVPAASYCGSGVTGAHNVAALMLAGIDAALYPGSWSQWSRHPENPVSIGDDEPAEHRGDARAEVLPGE
jgi:thiosulfate/3-mercaptopyruvate sulfurtransferase